LRVIGYEMAAGAELPRPATLARDVTVRAQAREPALA